jgi:hypothetical protein
VKSALVYYCRSKIIRTVPHFEYLFVLLLSCIMSTGHELFNEIGPSPSQEFDPRTVQPVAGHYTELATRRLSVDSVFNV